MALLACFALLRALGNPDDSTGRSVNLATAVALFAVVPFIVAIYRAASDGFVELRATDLYVRVGFLVDTAIPYADVDLVGGPIPRPRSSYGVSPSYRRHEFSLGRLERAVEVALRRRVRMGTPWLFPSAGRPPLAGRGRARAVDRRVARANARGRLVRRALGLALAAALTVALLAAGAALALTDAQVARGAAVFEQSVPPATDRTATTALPRRSRDRAVSSDLHPPVSCTTYTSTTMPLAAEGSLTQRQYLDVIGWLLVQRGQPSGAAELTLATLDVTPLQTGSMTTPTASPAPTASPTPVVVPVVTATPTPVAPSATGRSIRVQRNAFSEPDPRLAHNRPGPANDD